MTTRSNHKREPAGLGRPADRKKLSSFPSLHYSITWRVVQPLARARGGAL